MNENNLTKDEELYVEQMTEWIKEQERLERQLKETVEHHEFLAESNRKQLSLHQERIVMALKDYGQWKVDHGI
jgi:hypothetical protein